MNRGTALANLTRGVAEDVRDYQALRTLLQRQFDAALAHQAVCLGELAERITAMADILERRRLQRVDLVNALSGKGGSVAAAFALLPVAPRDMLQAGWSTLEELVRECKELNERNCRLMMDQYGILQRVLCGEEETYVPA